MPSTSTLGTRRYNVQQTKPPRTGPVTAGDWANGTVRMRPRQRARRLARSRKYPVICDRAGTAIRTAEPCPKLRARAATAASQQARNAKCRAPRRSRAVRLRRRPRASRPGEPRAANCRAAARRSARIHGGADGSHNTVRSTGTSPPGHRPGSACARPRCTRARAQASQGSRPAQQRVRGRLSPQRIDKSQKMLRSLASALKPHLQAGSGAARSVPPPHLSKWYPAFAGPKIRSRPGDAELRCSGAYRAPPVAPPMSSVHSRRPSWEPWLACNLQTGFAVDFQRSGAHLADVLGSHATALLTSTPPTTRNNNHLGNGSLPVSLCRTSPRPPAQRGHLRAAVPPALLVHGKR